MGAGRQAYACKEVWQCGMATTPGLTTETGFESSSSPATTAWCGRCAAIVAVSPKNCTMSKTVATVVKFSKAHNGMVREGMSVKEPCVLHGHTHTLMSLLNGKQVKSHRHVVLSRPLPFQD